MENIQKAIDVIARLRDPQNGCPWDLKQTHQSLLKYLIEESYEYIYAVEHQGIQEREEELGDILLQVLLHAQIASENQEFSIHSIAEKLALKMIKRHPHVFEETSNQLTEDEVKINWELIKKKDQKEKKFSIEKEDAYGPSLTSAYHIGKKSRTINFDWDKISDVILKVEEELQEVKEEIQLNQSQLKTKEEIGDLLFSVAQLARHLEIDPEEALKAANLKFITRVNQVEKLVREAGHEMKDLSTEKLEGYWQKVKQANQKE